MASTSCDALVGSSRPWVLVSLLALGGPSGCGDDTSVTDEGTSSSDGSTTEPQTSSVDSTGEGSTSEGSTGEPEVEACEGLTHMLYDPVAGKVDAYPDDFYTVAADTPTGLRVDLRLGENVTLTGTVETFFRVFEGASTLDGFGTTAGIYLQFDAPIDGATLPTSGEGSGSADASIVLMRLDVDPPVPVDFEWELVAEDPGEAITTLVLQPLVPLASQARYGVAVKSTVLDAEGGCVAPSEPTSTLLAGTAAPELDVAAAGVADVVAALQALGGIESELELAGAFAFTTQHTVDDSAVIAEQIRAAAPPTYQPTSPCTDVDPTAPYLQCEGTFTADDYTVGDVVDDSLTPQGQYEIPIVVYLPKGGTAPYPALIYGHGLSGDRFQASGLAEFAALDGIAVVAIDAPRHGDHPDAPAFNAVLEFFGLSLNLADPLDPLVLRDNFRRAGYDKLQLTQMLLAGVDLSGGPEPELDPASVHYLGVSLGGLMGPQLAAFAPELGTTTFIVPGARVTGIVAEGEQFSAVIGIFAGMATDGELARFFPLLQGVIDRGDPGTFAPWVTTRRPGFDDASPQVLVQMVLDDDTVPNSANAYFARAIGVPHLGEVVFPIGVVELEPNLPISGNLDAAHTGGSFQYDVILGADGMSTEPATHGNVARSSLAQLQIRTFLQTFLQTGVSEILDPYAELGVR
ncbi:hypothetical protein [Paraliomyxa miuraensis]|uniref:hypothetical protein n=1 Tax=Paraliomyxa miuraensis TaxID=376150 RepID=UPI00225B1EBB|nr:hypothetical protein [Paraliomyxa miuraensis]MCX4247506.1 hypothetical protein [Paraliomyxa miuraensis]